MKAIQQLISYFDERGRLAPAQVEQLVAKGYWGEYTAAELRSLENRIDQTFIFQATGNDRGPLWGTDVYTSDSNLGTACVHAGVLQLGEAGVVRVRIVQPVPRFQGSRRNGIASHDWTSGWSGAFQVEAVRK